MRALIAVLTNYFGLMKSRMLRRKRRRASEDEDPFIYPHF
jgi:hypothetical protein